MGVDLLFTANTDYNQFNWGDYFKQLYSDGVIVEPNPDALKVVASGGQSLTVTDGIFITSGFQIHVKSETLVEQMPSGSPRIDRVILRYDGDLATAQASVYIKQGSSSAPPPLERTLNVREYSLAQIKMLAGGTAATAEIIDERTLSDVCGIAGFYGNVSGALPPGAIIWFAAQGEAQGFLYCDGRELSRTVYARLFQAIGTIYGIGNGTTTFNIPDLRGHFVRCFDTSGKYDSGRVFGSRQDGTKFLGVKSSPMTYLSGGDYEGEGDYIAAQNNRPDPSKIMSAVPKNVSMIAMIKY